MKGSISLLTLFVTIAFSCGRNHVATHKSPRIYDFEKILTDGQEVYLDSVIADYERKTNKEILILTSNNLEGFATSTEYASDFGSEHGVDDHGDNTGLVIYVSDSLKKTALSTGIGKGKSLNNEICKKIVDSLMIPQFREDKYFEGLKAGLNECIKKWK